MNPGLAPACVPALTRYHPPPLLAPHLGCGTFPAEVGELRAEDGSLLPPSDRVHICMLSCLSQNPVLGPRNFQDIALFPFEMLHNFPVLWNSFPKATC